MKVSSLILSFTSLSAFAAGGGHGGLGDLVAPGVNFAILLIFAIVKLKKPMSEQYEETTHLMKMKLMRKKELTYA